MLSPELLLAAWVGVVALQLADVVLTASRLPQLSAFSAIKAELAGLIGQHVPPAELERYREEIDALDARETARSVPVGRGATAQLWIGTPWRLAPVGLAFATVIAMVAAGAQSADFLPSALMALALPGVTYLLALAAARASVAAARARTTVHELHLTDIDELITRVSRGSRKRIAGLGDRVNRALQILREQQK